ncbi:YadA-like family protein, partial [Neisseria cinerea]|uniref:YadA-like family protein n=1 Tax=Neisseria cinerea TaxID=483 RepID=UPI0028D499E3
DKGDQGIQGERGLQGEKGEQGKNGANGENGKSAYEIWKSLDTAKRADKTEQDFIDSLKGEADTTFTRTEESDGTMLTAKGKITNERPNGEVRISGLAAGRISPSSSDAVNGAQLFEVNERISSIEQKVDKLDKSMNGGIAKAGAVALLPQPTYAGHSMVSASTAHYNGEQALAIGYSSLSDNGKVILKAGASFNFSGNNTKKPLFGAAFGYQW